MEQFRDGLAEAIKRMNDKDKPIIPPKPEFNVDLLSNSKIIKYNEHVQTYSTIFKKEIYYDEFGEEQSTHFTQQGNHVEVSSFKGLHTKIFNKYDWVFIDLNINCCLECDSPYFAEFYEGLYPTYVCIEADIIPGFKNIVGRSTYDNPPHKNTTPTINVYVYEHSQGKGVIIFDSKSNDRYRLNNFMNAVGYSKCCVITNCYECCKDFIADIYYSNFEDQNASVWSNPNPRLRTTVGTGASRDLGGILYDALSSSVDYYRHLDKYCLLCTSPSIFYPEFSQGLKSTSRMYKRYIEDIYKKYPNTVIDTSCMFYRDEGIGWVDGIIIPSDDNTYYNIYPKDMYKSDTVKIFGKVIDSWTVNGVTETTWTKYEPRKVDEGNMVIDMDLTKYFKAMNMTDEKVIDNFMNDMYCRANELLDRYNCGGPKKLFDKISSTRYIIVYRWYYRSQKDYD